MTRLTIKDDETYETIELTEKEAIDVELKLNVTSKGHEWKHIGDVLFNFGSNNQEAIFEYTVTSIQMEFIKMLMTKNSYQECRGL
jgi:hypothetical protein